MYISITRMRTHTFSLLLLQPLGSVDLRIPGTLTQGLPLSRRLCSSLIHAFQNVMLRNSSTWNSSQLLIALNDEIFKLCGAAGALPARSLAVSRFWRSNLEM